MGCPICEGNQVDSDSLLDKEQGKRIAIQGKVSAITPPNSTYLPFEHYFTISLSPRRGQVKYIKFRTKQELDQWSFERGKSFIVHGCLHVIDGRELVFNITRVEPIQ